MRGPLSGRCVCGFVLAAGRMHQPNRPLTPALSPEGGEGEDWVLHHRFHGAHQFFVTRTPKRRGSVRNTLVVKPLSSEFRKSPVMAVLSKMFFT